MSLNFIFCLHTLRKVTHFFVNELSNINDIGINFKCTHADRKWITLSKQFSLTAAKTISVKMTAVILTERVAFKIFAWQNVAAWQNQYLHETKLVSHHFSRIVYQQTADKQTSLKTLTPQTASLFLFTDFTDILLNVNVALIDVVSLVVNVFNKNNNNLLTNAAKCQIVSPVLWRVLQ